MARNNRPPADGAGTAVVNQDDALLRLLADVLTLGGGLTPVQRAHVEMQLSAQRDAVKVFLAGLGNRTIRDLVRVVSMQEALLTRLTDANIVKQMTPIELVEATKVVSAVRNDLTTYLAEGDQRDMFGAMLRSLFGEQTPAVTEVTDLAPAQRERIRAIAARVVQKAENQPDAAFPRALARLVVRVVQCAQSPRVSLVVGVAESGRVAVCGLRALVREDIVIPDAF